MAMAWHPLFAAMVACFSGATTATTITDDASYDAAFMKMAQKQGEIVRRFETGMHNGDDEWTTTIDWDADGKVTVKEMHHMALMPDEDNAEDMAIVEGLKSYYLSKPENVKVWEDTKMHEFSAFPDAGNDPYEWFKHSGFFKAYLKLYDRDGDGASPAPSLLSVRAVAVATYIDLLL